jgi:hypothetical protein
MAKAELSLYFSDIGDASAKGFAATDGHNEEVTIGNRYSKRVLKIARVSRITFLAGSRPLV